MAMVEKAIRHNSGGGVRRISQRFGDFMVGMIIPNIAAFIAWGLITALFIPTGWTPNAHIDALVTPFITFLLPLLIGYSGGKLIYGHRGGVVGAIATAGIAVGSSVPMFLGAMLMGPLGGYLVKKFDNLIESKIPVGFEMLINNFTAGIIGGGLAILAYLIIGPVMNTVTVAFASGAMWVTKMHLLPFIAIFIEPGKVLFLNNAIDYGVLVPLGVQQAHEVGKSIFFLLESNPGPGVGMLVAYWMFGKGNAKASAPSAIIIQFLGGIHEIYFPYVLMRPLLVLAVIAGGLVGDTTFMLLHAGLIAPAAPGSIFAEIMMSPKGGLFPVLAGIFLAAVTSFLVSSVILKRAKTTDTENDDLDKAKSMVQTMKKQSKGLEVPAAGNETVSSENVLTDLPKQIIFACEAGMGSSAMGASILKRKLKDAGFQLDVQHLAVHQLPKDSQIVFTQINLAHVAQEVAPTAKIYTVDNFLDKAVYDKFVDDLKKLKN